MGAGRPAEAAASLPGWADCTSQLSLAGGVISEGIGQFGDGRGDGARRIGASCGVFEVAHLLQDGGEPVAAILDLDVGEFPGLSLAGALASRRVGDTGLVLKSFNGTIDVA